MHVIVREQHDAELAETVKFYGEDLETFKL